MWLFLVGLFSTLCSFKYPSNRNYQRNSLCKMHNDPNEAGISNGYVGWSKTRVCSKIANLRLCGCLRNILTIGCHTNLARIKAGNPPHCRWTSSMYSAMTVIVFCRGMTPSHKLEEPSMHLHALYAKCRMSSKSWRKEPLTANSVSSGQVYSVCITLEHSLPSPQSRISGRRKHADLLRRPEFCIIAEPGSRLILGKIGHYRRRDMDHSRSGSNGPSLLWYP